MSVPGSIARSVRQLLRKVPLEQLTAADLPRIRRWVSRRREAHYGDSWTYIAQAVNGRALGLSPLGYKFEAADALCPVGLFARPIDGCLSIHIVNPLGRRALTAVQDLACRLRQAGDWPIYLKKPAATLARHALRLEDWRLASGPWHRQAPWEDDTYPEVILAVPATLRLIESRASEIGDKYARFLRRTRGDIAWVDLGGREDDARSVVRQFFAVQQSKHIDISMPSDYENMIVLRGSAATSRALCYIDGEPVAMVVFERLGGSDAVGLYCNLALYQRYKYLSEYTVVEALKRTAGLGIRFMNLGGSETTGLHTFKQKFRPADTRKSLWLEYSDTEARAKRS